MKPYDRTTYSGRTVDWITRAALVDAAAQLGYDDGLTLTQGSYNAGKVTASAGTHDGGGVVDLAPFEHARKVKVLRRLGFAAWHRPELWRGDVRVWPEHVHAVLIGNRKLSPSARDQVVDYLAGRNGLADNGPDTGPRQYVNRRYSWRKGEKRITEARRLLARANALLSTGIRGYPRVHAARNHVRAAQARLPKVK